MADVSRYAAPTPRGLELLVGIVAMVLGAPVLLFGVLAGVSVFRGHLVTSQVVLAVAAVGVGLLLLTAGFRLLTHKSRGDGGLLSPWLLRLGGLIFLVGPFAMLANNHALMAFVKAGSCVAAGVACFFIARRRESAKVHGADDAPE